MKAEQRIVYVALSDQVNYQVCAFCKFSAMVVCGESECTHGLADRYGFPGADDYLEPGDDCWGFRPTHKPEVAADIVGIILVNGWEVAGWDTQEDGKVAVSGTKEWI
jgi:hypothetical protein